MKKEMLVFSLLILLAVLIVYAAAPTIDTLVLNATTYTNSTSSSITVHVTTSDSDGDNVKVIYNWYKNGTSITVLNLPFENNTADISSDTKDYSQYSNNGTVSGPTWKKGGGHDGKGAYDFDGGNDYIDLGNSVNFPDGTSARTMCVWAKTDTTAGGYRWAAAYGTASSGQTMFIGQNGATLDGGSWGDDLTETNFWQANIWKHVCLTYNGSKASLYGNGTLLTSADKTWSLVKNKAYIGRQVNGAEYWNGIIDDVTIYNRSLSAEQILTLYQNKSVINSSETIVNDVWKVKATPNDGTSDGSESTSNDLVILANTLPSISSIILNSTNITTNHTGENLTVYTTTSDLDGDNVKVTYNWYWNGTSITALNMPFEKINGTDTNNAWDYSSYGNDGTVSGAIWDSNGGYDGKGAYDFDGSNDYIDLGNPSSFPNGTSPKTMCVRAKTDTTGSGYRWVAAYGKNSDNQAFFIGLNGATLIGGGYGGTDLTSANFWELGVWKHVCLTYNGSKAFLYGEGVLLNSGDKSWNIVRNNAYIGRQVNGAEYWDGIVDDVIIYNRSLSAEQVSALFRNQTDIMVTNETEVNDEWKTKAYPNDGYEDGAVATSGTLTVTNSTGAAGGGGGGGGSVPEFSDYAMILLLLTVIGGFFFIRKES